MVFIGREREIGWMRLYLEHEANKILAVTGKANCGKTALMQEVMKRLAKTHTFYYVDLRFYHILHAQDLALVLYKMFYPEKLYEEVAVKIGPFEIKLEEKVNAVEIANFLNALFDEITVNLKKVKNPVLVVDELQVLKELYVNGEKKLIDRLMEFFISLTKHQHLAHVIVLTSDSTFYAELYEDSGMQKRMIYKILDELAKEEAMQLIKYYLQRDNLPLSAREVYRYTGGNPALIDEVLLRTAIEGGDKRAFRRIIRLMIEDEKWRIERVAKKAKLSLKPMESYDYEEGMVFVEENVLFFNVDTKKYEPQHSIIELVWNELLEKKGE